MKIATPLQADHQLDQLAGQFAHWRQTRTHPYGRIPQTLWEQAVALAAALPPSCVAKQLRVRLAGPRSRRRPPLFSLVYATARRGGRRGAGGISTDARIVANSDRGFGPKNRSAAVVPSARVRKKLWIAVRQ